jgi:hypothetical protein
MVERKTKIELTKDETGRHLIDFECTSSLYGVTDAGGYAEDALKYGCVRLGDGCDYILTPDEKTFIRRKL